ncbi:MAG: hypothetical protein M3P06_06025 [Acidobacteriota bacterium]|nr:hypothetical protein [Acidobacteriota bacterium]
MLTHGSDRARRTGEKVLLHSAIPKGWTPRTPKSLTHAEFPGTTVLWDEQYFEVIEATALPAGGVRYVLAEWSESHTIRQFEHYDAESEALRMADHARALRQRRTSIVSRLSGMFLGYLPAPVQIHLENELGVRASTMTILSCIPALVLFGACILAHVDASTRHEVSPVPTLLWPVAYLLMIESGTRFYVAMSQSRPMGSVIGLIGYSIYRALSSKRDQLPPAIGARGDSVAFTAPTADEALRGSFQVKEPLLTLLSPAEQQKLAERFGFDYRRNGYGVAWVILVCASLGAITSYLELEKTNSFTSLLSMLIAGGVAIEQAVRLHAFRKGPAGSVFGFVVRPIVRNLL